ncbi:MAG: gephyrin-like molybdotransferase Glp [Pseudomonadota bacterium]
MITSERALELITRKATRLPVERRALDRSLGYVLARDVRTAIDFPPFDRSAMDGYAVAGGDAGSVLTVKGEICAGGRPRAKVGPGEAVKIMTGAMLPPGAARVVMKENADILDGGRVRIRIAEGKDNISRKGVDLKKGSVLYGAGQAITPVVLANLAAAGIGDVRVYRKPRVAILVTGSELLKPGVKYEMGKIYNSNGPLLHSLLTARGFSEAAQGGAADSLPALVSALRKAFAASDVVIITGGVSVGDYDFVQRAFDSIGCRLHFSKVAIQPGKPFTFATHGKKTVFALPGNPVAVFVTWFLFALPAVMKMSGIEFTHRRHACIFKGTHVRRNAEREQYVPVRFAAGDSVEAIPFHGSGDLYSLSRADALMKLPIGKSKVADGEMVEVLKLDVY